MFQLKNKNDTDDAELSLNIGGSVSAGGHLDLNRRSSDNDFEDDTNANIKIDTDLKIKESVGDIDVILGGKQKFQSDDEEEANANISIGVNNGLDIDIEADIGVKIGVDENTNQGIELEVDANTNQDIEIEFDSNTNPDIEIEVSNKLKLNDKKKLGFQLPDVDLESPDIESKKVYVINKEIDKTPLRDPDIHIRIDMDEVNKTANFVIDMPDQWNKKLLNKWDDPKFRGDKKLNGFPDLDENDRGKERLDVEINMYIGKEDLDDSTVYAVIRTIDIAEEEDYSKKFEFKFQLPKFDFPTFSLRSKSSNADTDVQADIDPNVPESDIDLDGSTKRRDFRYQLPKVQFPSFKIKEKPSVDADIEVEGDLDSPSKRSDFRFKFPKVDFSLFGNVQKSGDVNVDVEDEIRPEDVGVVKSEIEIESPTKRYDFRFKFPTIEFPSFGGKGNVNTDASLDVDGNAPETDLNVDGTPKRYDFRYQLPKVDLPKVDLPKVEFPTLIYLPKSHNAMADIDINTNKADINADLELESPSANFNNDNYFKRPNFQFQLPTIDFTIFKRKDKAGEVDVDVDLDVKDADVEADGATKRFDFRYQFPKIEFPSLSGRWKAKPDDDLEIEVEVNRVGLEASAEIPDSEISDESPTKRRDFRFQLPKVEFPSFNLKGNANIDEKIDGEVDAEVESPTKRYDFSYKFPKIEFPLFGGFHKSANANAEVAVDEDAISPEIDTVQKSEVEIDVDSPTKRNYFSIQMPKLNFPSFRGREKANVEGAGEIDADINTKVESNDAEDDEQVKRHDFRFQLPKISLPSFNIKQKIDAARNFGLELDPETRRYDFMFAYPDSKFNTSEGKVVFRDDSVEHDSDFNEFSVLFDEGDSSRSDENIFKVHLKNGQLKCKERHCGEWQHETNQEVICFSPNKNWLVVFLPKNNESEVVVVFNEEVVVKYHLEACINTLQSFDVEGAVKIHSAKLFGE